jgi:hypothetical protein
MRANRITMAAALTVVLTASGCETMEERIPEEHRGAATGAGIGAATGAAAGAILGEDAKSAVLGGLLGGLIGGAVGHYAYDRQRTAQETANQYGYRPTKGTLVSVEGASVRPTIASPGEDVHLRTTYAVLSPNPDREIPVTEIREIRHAGELVGRPEVRVVRTAGTYTSTIPIRLSPNADPGLYEVTSMVRAGGESDAEQTTFRVR